MGYLFSKNGGQNDPFWKDTDTALKLVIKDMDTGLKDDDKLVKDLFLVEKSKKFAEKLGGLTEMGNMTRVAEGAPAPSVGIQAGFTKLIEHSTFMSKFSCTQEMKEDGSINVMKTGVGDLMVSYKRTRAEFATAALTTEGDNFTFGGESFDKKTADGLSLFNTSHIAKVAGIATQSNVYTNEFGSDATMLYTLANIGRNFVNDSGHVMAKTFDTIIIPGNVPALEETIKRIIRTDLVVNSANNDVNTQKGLWKLIVNKRWIATSGTLPYILTSSEANRSLRGGMFYDRTPLDIRNWVDEDTRNLMWTSRARFSCGFNNWRPFILGGAAAGTTLS